MAVDEGKYAAIISALGGAGGAAAPASSGPIGGPNVITRDRDLGRGPGGPGGGRQNPNTAQELAGRGISGQGYGEDDVREILRGMPPERIAAIQRQMQQAGLLPDSFRSFGFVDNTTRSAFVEILDVANTRGASYQTTLDSLEQGGKELLAEARREQARANIAKFTPEARIYNASDPAAVRQTAEQAFQQALGRKPKADELNRFVQSWQSMERSEQTAGFDAQDAAGRYKVDQANSAAGLTGDPVDALLGAIGTQESGNDYNARNGRTGASGKYQIMPANWPAWSAEAGLGSDAPRTAENQEKVARYKMSQYVEQFGQEGAAVAWYAGPGAAKKWLENPNQSRFQRKQGKGNEPSIKEYVSQVMGRMGGGAQGAAGTGGGSEAEELMSRLQQMVKDSPYEIGLGKTTRSYEEQVRLYNEYKSGRGPLAAKPGTSKHGDGRANDLKYSSDKARQWVIANAAKYGLALPLYDPNKPRSKDESWHVELADGHSYGDGHNHGGAAPTSTVQQADLGAQAVEFARNVNPDEYQAYQIGGQFNNLVQILQRGVGV